MDFGEAIKLLKSGKKVALKETRLAKRLLKTWESNFMTEIL